MHILLVEDECKVAAYLRKGLSENSFTVDAAQDGVDGLHMAQTGSYDLIILDVMLPGRDGWSIIQELRDQGSSVPVLFLTARDSVQDRVKGLELGTDDYLVKPFSFSELLARVRTILRRGGSRQAEVLDIGDLHIDLLRRAVTRAGAKLPVTAKEFALLWLLARRSGEVLSRTFIAEQVWDMNFDSDTKCGRRRGAPTARQDRRSPRTQAHSYGTRHGLRARGALIACLLPGRALRRPSGAHWCPPSPGGWRSGTFSRPLACWDFPPGISIGDWNVPSM
jgi:two-component system copper resistance phosphate regulon response regulator CusR